ncbi:DUF4097 family beta strand repeat-containing protein [Nocardia sp. NPDC057668]|uniref:DUF4097 family beta strand repeat-containing protein n=1 Tax=Nocardia sp. NPDC057668 TaxID=3346202 RepID=UPI00366C5AC9
MPTFQTPAAITAIVDVPAGYIRVIASDRTDTVVEVHPTDPHAKNDVRAAGQVQIDCTAGHLTVKMPRAWRAYAPFGGTPSIEVTVQVPAGSNLKATAALGRLLVSGPFGDCDLGVSAGDIAVEGPGGSVTAKTAKGDIRVSDAVRGDLRLETSMGEVEVGIHPASGVQLDSSVQHGSVQNLLAPVARPDADTVRVHVRNSYGNIVVRHSAAV